MTPVAFLSLMILVLFIVNTCWQTFPICYVNGLHNLLCFPSAPAATGSVAFYVPAEELAVSAAVPVFSEQ